MGFCVPSAENYCSGYWKYWKNEVIHLRLPRVSDFRDG